MGKKSRAKAEKRKLVAVPPPNLRASVRFQNDAEQALFRQANASFIDYLPDFYKACDVFFEITLVDPNPAHQAVHALNGLAAQSFHELLMLAANGQGYGAMKLLRVVYEHVVSAGYIANNPETAERFFAFQHIQNWKMANRIEQDFKAFGATIPPEVRSEVDRNREEIKGMFDKNDSSWSGVPLDKMAKAAGQSLERPYVFCANHAAQYIHSSALALADMLRPTSTGVTIDFSPNRPLAAFAIKAAHGLIVSLFRISAEFFSLNRDGELANAEEAFTRIWPAPPVPDITVLRAVDSPR